MEEHGLKNQRIAREMFVKLYGERPLALRKKYEHGLKNQRIAREMFVKLYGERPLALRKKYRQA